MIKAGDRIEILPEWRDAGDASLSWVARSDEEKGRLEISALELQHLPLWPMQTVRADMIRKIEGGQS